MRTIVTICMFLFFFQMLSFAAWAEDGPETLLKSAMKGGTYVEPSTAELKWAETAFTALFRGDFDNLDSEALKKFGLETGRVQLRGETYFYLKEQSTARKGRGIFFFRTGKDASPVLTVPHGKYDKKTDKIGIKLFLEGEFAACAFNTVSRYGPDKSEFWDLAKLESSYFNAFTRAFVQVMPEQRMYQLHGFTAKKRKTRQGREAWAIASSGTKRPSSGVVGFYNCLKKDKMEVDLYPYDVSELGGTTNIQGRIMRSLGHSGFIHVEFSSDARNEILKNEKIRKNLLKCMD